MINIFVLRIVTSETWDNYYFANRPYQRLSAFTLEKIKKGSSIRDHQQITFVMLNRFWQFSKTPPPPSLILLEQGQAFPFLQCISSFEGTSYKNYRIRYDPQFIYLLFYLSFCISISFFTNFLNFIQYYLKKYFCINFSFSNGFTQASTPLMTKTCYAWQKPFVDAQSYKTKIKKFWIRSCQPTC